LKIIGPPAKYSDREISIELCESRTITRVARFAFPDFDDNAYEMSSLKLPLLEISGGAKLNRYDLYLHTFRPSYHTFSMKVSNENKRIYAHVLRYLPMHEDVYTRCDVGRRGERAMVLFTRAGGAQRFFGSVLKTILSLKMNSISLPNRNHKTNKECPLKSFLHTLQYHHTKLCLAFFSECKLSTQNQNVPNIQTKLKIHKCELRINHHQNELLDDDDDDQNECSPNGDMFTFNLPDSLQPGFRSDSIRAEVEYIYSPIVPLLRCLGSSQMMRLISALLCEYRIVFVSNDVSRLSESVHGALAILAQGLLVWRYALVPVLPPHLFKHLAERRPFIVGVLRKYISNSTFMKNVVNGVLFVDLDKNTLRTFKVKKPEEVIPDLLDVEIKKNSKATASPQSGRGAGLSTVLSSSEMLENDLSSILASDNSKWNISNKPQQDRQPKSSEEVAEPSRVKKVGGIRSLFGGILGGKKDNNSNSKKEVPDVAENHDFAAAVIGNMLRVSRSTEEEGDDTVKGAIMDESEVAESYISYENEEGEERLRACLVCFFLEMYGDMGMYFSLPSKNNDKNLVLDTKKYLLRKKQMGLEENTPMLRVIFLFSQSSIFTKFTQSRIAEAESRCKMLPDHTPLFTLCERQLRKTRKAFNVENIREIVFSSVNESPQHLNIKEYERVREKALALTSEKPIENSSNLVKVLLDDCKECNICYQQVINVVWMRIWDAKSSSQWQQILVGLSLLRNLLLHGPLMVVAEIILGIRKIHKLNSYNTKHEEAKQTIQWSAKQIYLLVVNVQTLFLRRKKILLTSSSRPICDIVDFSHYIMRRISPNMDFKSLHELLRPHETVAPFFRREEKFNESTFIPNKYDDGRNKVINAAIMSHSNLCVMEYHGEAKQLEEQLGGV